MTKSDNPANIRRAVPLPKSAKERLRRFPPVRDAWTAFRRAQLHREYEARREHYHAEATARGLVYSEAWTRDAVRKRLADRGYTPAKRTRGEIHAFAVFPVHSWHDDLLPDLRELGPVSQFDFVQHGFAPGEFVVPTPQSNARRDAMNRMIVPALRAAHAARPVDWVLAYGGGHELSPAVFREITSELGIPVVNFSLDDKQGFSGLPSGDARAGQIDLTAAFDLFGTSARVACEWHMVEGGRPLYLPEGFNASAYAPRDVPRDLDVSFVGVAYGFRTALASFLESHGVRFEPFGNGWPNGKAADIVDIFNRSRINLGMGGIEYSEELTNLKARDFEVPGTGGGVYITSYNADLAQHFVIGEEILCYRGRDEMLELIRYYLAHPEEAGAIARRGRERCLREHRWLHRYEKMLEIIGIA